MKSLVLTLLGVCCATASFADVLIYRGPCVIEYDVVLKEETVTPPRSAAYIIIDFDRSAWMRFQYYTKAGKRVYLRSGSPISFRGGNAVLPSGQSATVYTTGLAQQDASFYQFYFARFGGLNVPLKIRNDPTPTTVARPRIASFGIRESRGTDGAASFLERNHALRFDAARTIRANDANETLESVMTKLIAEFEAKGYVIDEG